MAGTIEKSGATEKTYLKILFAIDSTESESIISVLQSDSNASVASQFATYCLQAESASNVSIPYLHITTGSTWQTLSIMKSYIREVYVDFAGASDTNSSFLRKSFTALSKVTVLNVLAIGNDFGRESFSSTRTAELILGEGIADIKQRFLYDSGYNGDLILPGTIRSIGPTFCQECDNLRSIYIPSNVPVPSGAGALSSDITASTASAPAYANGVILKGPGAKAWKQTLTDKNTYPFRKLILDPEWA